MAFVEKHHRGPGTLSMWGSAPAVAMTYPGAYQCAAIGWRGFVWHAPEDERRLREEMGLATCALAGLFRLLVLAGWPG